MTCTRRLRPLAVAAAVLLAGVAPGVALGADTITFFPRADDMPFSEAVQVGSILHLNNQIGTGSDPLKVVPGGFEQELRRTMENIGTILRKHHLGYSAVFKCHINLLDMGNFDTLNQIYGSYFRRGHYPVRSTVGVASLPRGASVGLECLAWNPARR